MLRSIRNILFIQYMLIAIISFILVVNTNYSAFGKTPCTEFISGYNQSKLVSVIIDCIHYTENEAIANFPDSATTSSPIEEENRLLEEELISHKSDTFMAVAIQVKLNHILAQCIKHNEPHIEFLTPPPEA